MKGVKELQGRDYFTELKGFFIQLLEERLADALLIPQETPWGDNVIQTYVRDPRLIGKVNPFVPVLPLNSAKVVSSLNREKIDKKIGVLLRPCEERSLIELVKLKQATLDNLILIGVDCYGTYSVGDYSEMAKRGEGGAAITFRFLEKMERGDELPQLREACKLCRFRVAKNVDLSLLLFGVDLKGEIAIEGKSERGVELLRKLGFRENREVGEREEKIGRLMERRNQYKEKVENLPPLISLISTCIKCQNCRRVCPICYCKECFFDTPTFEYEPIRYFRWAERRGALRMPVDTLLYHLTRMSHVVASCVGCGQCESACPSKIPLGKIYSLTSERVGELLGYEPGRSLEEELPFVTFREEELKIVER